jgi:hypothetical protein
MNGLKPELKTIVMTKEPKNVEELRHRIWYSIIPDVSMTL